MFTALILASLAAPSEPSDLASAPETDLLDECRPHFDLHQDVSDWTIVDARGMTDPARLARAIEATPEGSRLVVRGGDFGDADMRALAPLLQRACLHGTVLDGTNWEGSEIEGLQLERGSFTQAQASEVSWPGFSARGVALRDTTFEGAFLPDMRLIARYEGIDLREVNFQRAELRGASFHCGITVDVSCWGAPDFRGSSLVGANLSSFGIWEAEKFAGAKLNQTRVSPQSLLYLGEAVVEGELVLTHYSASPYPDGAEHPVPAVTVSPEEARLLISTTQSEVARREPGNPSFECAAAATTVETIICGPYDGHLRDLDLRLSSAWKKVRAAGKSRIAEQRAWLRERNACEDRLCIELAYNNRIAQLKALLGQDLILAPDQSVHYYFEVLPLPEAARSWDVYARILPVLESASYQTITLTGLEDGSVRAEGSAVGGNAHLCSLDIPEARYDASTGWWTGTTQDGMTYNLFRTSGRRIDFRYSGNLGNTPIEVSEFMSCGARAGFDTAYDLSADNGY